MKKFSVKTGYRLRGPRMILRQWQLHLLILLPVIYIAIFHYWPMYGAQIAFRNYRAKDGITGSEWVGLKWFIQFFTSYNAKEVITNTLAISFYQIIVGFPIPVIFALMINAIPAERFKRFTQTVTYMPHFISVVVLVSMFNLIFSPVSGLYGTLYRLLGGEGYPYDFRGMANTFRHIYVWTGVWQSLGWDTIIYTAALSSVSPDQHEAATLDGASRWKRVLHVDLPAILPTIGIMLIMRCGRVMSIGFEKVYLLQSTLNRSTSQIIATYVYEVGMGSGRDFSFAAAIGLFNSVINCILLVTVNWLSKRISRKEVSLF